MHSSPRVFAALFATLLPVLAAAQAPTPNPGAVPAPTAPSYASSGPGTDRSGRTYLSVKLGAISPQHDDISAFSTGFSLEGALGYRVNPNVALELSVGRFALSATAPGVIGGFLATITEDVVAYPVLGTLKLVLPLTKLDLFGLVGGGVYFIQGEVKATAPGFAALSNSDSDSTFGLHLGGGLNVHVSPHASFGAELKYIIGSAKLFDGTGHFNSLIFAGTLTYTM
jgi:hypothetical protein